MGSHRQPAGYRDYCPRLISGRRLSLVWLLLLLFALAACATSTTSLDQAAKPSEVVDAQAKFLAQELAELDALPTPAGADPAEFAQLKAALRQLLLVPSAGIPKGTSAGAGVDVTDLTATDQGGGNVLLAWTYRHLGDYDQNGDVNINDLSPIGMHYHKTTASGDWNLAEVADGDLNGEVNIGDLTPIGSNFGSRLTGYLVESTATPGDAGSWTAAGNIAFSQGAIPGGQARVRFTTILGGQPAGLSYRVVGQWTTTGGGGNQAPQAALTGNPLTGAAPLLVDLDASGSNDPDGSIVKYEWDWEDDGTWDLDSGTDPTVSCNYPTPGASWTTRVRVTDNGGLTDTATVTITTSGGGNQAPQAALTGNPLTGASPLTVNFDASGSVDPDGSIVKYEWDYQDNGSWVDTGATATGNFTYNGDALSWTARVRVTDNGGLTDTAIVTISTTGGGAFVEPPIENFTDLSQPGDTAARKWLLNCYRPLAPWDNSKHYFQTAQLKDWADQVLALTNQERANNGGLPPLTLDLHLEAIAQAHARDMALQNYFDHDNLYGMAPTARIEAADGTIWSNNGENIACGIAMNINESPQDTVNRWMNSPGHRANILSPNFTYLGVGVYYRTSDPNHYYAYFVQVFASYWSDPNAHDWLDPGEVPGP